MIDMPAPLRWVRNPEAIGLTYQIISDEWFGWQIAQVHRHPSMLWSSRVSCYCLERFLQDAATTSQVQSMRWAERWTRAQWPVIERQLYERATRTPMGSSMWRQREAEGRAPVLRCVR